MPIKNLTLPKFHAIDVNGNPLAGGKVYTYEAGTTTDQVTYTDADKSSQNTNPVILDSNGEADIWYDVDVKIKLDNSANVQQWVIDNIPPNAAPTSSGVFNLVDNGSFEDSNTQALSWALTNFPDGTVAVDTSDRSHGKNSLKFTGAGSGGGTATSLKFPVTTLAGIFVKFEYKSSAVNTLNSVQVKWYNAADTALSTDTLLSEGTANPTIYTQYTRAAYAPANAVQGEIILKGVDSGGTQLTGTTNFDNIVVSTETSVDQKGVASPVNHLQVTNAALNNPILITPVGTGTNSGITLTGKGTGGIILDADTVTIADGNNDFNIASHDGINGLKLAGTLITATGVKLNYVDVVAGTAQANKAVVLDSNKDVTGLGDVTATTFIGALTGTASTVTTNADLTGEVTSTGNTATISADVIGDNELVPPAAGSSIIRWILRPGQGITSSSTSYPSIDNLSTTGATALIGYVQSSGVVRINYDIRAGSSSGAEARIVKNFVEVDTQSTVQNTFVTKTYDATVAAGDVLTLQLRLSAGINSPDVENVFVSTAALNLSITG